MTSAAAGPIGRAVAWLGGAAFVASLGYCAYSFVVRFGRHAPAGDVLGPVAVDTALFAAFALHHSVFARTGIKDALARYVPGPLERSAYVWVSSVLLVVVCWWWRPVPSVLYEAGGALRAIGWLVQAAGVVMTLRAARVLDVWELSGIRQAAGDRRSASFRVVGPYHLVRHPIYLGWALMTLGCPVMTGTRLAFAVISTAYLAIAIPFEERALIEAFGQQYRAYRARVRWRMLPGVY